MKSINPTTGQEIQVFDEIDDAELERRLALAESTFREWRRSTFSERARLMRRVAELLESEKQKFGRLMTTEMGKTIRAAVAEAEKCALGCRYYAEHAERFLAPEPIATNVKDSFVAFQPIGTVLAIMPWNFPFWQVIRFAAPALMAGNVGLLKHASNVPQCALAIEDLFRRAGFPDGAFQTLLISSARVEGVLRDPRIRAATLTGSESAGSKVASVAGHLIKKTVLELGGSDPFIVMPSADLDAAIGTAVTARTVNNGQSCIAAKRFIVHEQIADAFERGFVQRMGSLRVGDPLDDSTDVGPLATAQIRHDLHEQVQATLSAGARALLGGAPLDRPGYFYAPTVLTDIPPDSPASRDELFGPVASLFRVPNLDGAIALANSTRFGLGSAAWTNEAAERRRFIEDIEAGLVFINGMVASDPRLPFGGVKDSGYGRELSSFGIREFVNIKTVWIADSERS
jgi:succinate-semialdehyde dehydrogenase/glutarate-semialdehyde dehydrogenase